MFVRVIRGYYQGVNYLVEGRVIDVSQQEFIRLKADGAVVPFASQAYQPLSGGQGVVLHGDSLFANEIIFDATQNKYMDRGVFTWANALAGNRFTLLRNSGLGGDTAANGLARFDTDVAPYYPKHVPVRFGTNDLTLSVSAQNIFTSLVGMYQKVYDIGASCYAMTVPPAENGFGFNQDAARRYQWSKLNDLIRDYCAANPVALLVDEALAISDPSDSTGIPLAAFSMITGVHYKSRAARACGALLAKAMIGALREKATYAHNADTWKVNSSSSNIANVSRAVASGGSLGAGTTGVTSTGFIVGRSNGSNATAVSACVPRRVQDTTAWAALTAYTLGLVRRATVLDQAKPFAYICTTAGTSHATTEPIWPVVPGATIVDGAATWTCVRTSYTDKPGFWQAAVVSGNTALESFGVFCYMGNGDGRGGWAVGQTVTAEAEVQMQGASGVVGLFSQFRGLNSMSVNGLGLSESVSTDFDQTDFAGVIGTPPQAITAGTIPGTTQLWFEITVRLEATGKAIVFMDCVRATLS